MAYLLALMYTGVTVVREGSGGKGDSPPATSSICVMPTLSTAALIALSIDRRSRHVTLPWWQNVWISTNLGPKNMAEEKNIYIFPCMTALRNKTVVYTFFRIVRQCKQPSLSRKIFEIQKFCLMVLPDETILSYHRCSVVRVTGVEGLSITQSLWLDGIH